MILSVTVALMPGKIRMRLSAGSHCREAGTLRWSLDYWYRNGLPKEAS
jgi:hypothetical protein